MDKIFESPAAAVADVPDGATIMFGGFGAAGVPGSLINALHEKAVRDIVAISNGSGNWGAEPDVALLLKNGQLKKFIGSFPILVSAGRGNLFRQVYLEGKIELEVVPQGTWVERIRAAGAGIPGFYTATGVGTVVAEGKETRMFDGREYLLETALPADYAFIRAHKADHFGNLIYRKSSRNFNPIMATAGRVTIVEVDEIVEPGELDPDAIVTPGIFVDRIVRVTHRWGLLWGKEEAAGKAEGRP
jgi:3-oxoacid CoA-transferase A subunit